MSANAFQRHPANPVIPVVPNTWRNYVTANVDILRWRDEWRLYFRGNHKDGNGVVHAQIGLLTCPLDRFDGVTWTEYPGNPVTMPGEPGSIDDMGAIDPSVIAVNGKFLMYYTAVPFSRPVESAQSGGSNRGRTWGHAVKSIALAVSDDGLRFRRWGAEPVVAPFSAAPEVVFHDGQYWLFYSEFHERGGTDICVLRSADPYRFDRAQRQMVLTVGAPGSWEALSVTTARIFWDNGLWYMVYAGSGCHEDTPWHFGVAASHDLLHWTKYAGNPVFERGKEGEWDDCGIWYGTTIKVGDTYYMWYEGRSSGEPRSIADARPGGRGRGGFSQIGLATMRSDIFFTNA
jgi:predicted GH43/DUF377 family glycosyl hydrolase